MNDVHSYLQGFDEATTQRLETLRSIVHREVPHAIEGMAYGMIGYTFHDKPLVYFGGFTRHVGFYATPLGHAEFAKDLSGYKQGKGSVQFPHDEPLPIELITRMVQFKKSTLDQ